MKSNPDPILTEIWRIKDRRGTRTRGDIRSLVRELKSREKESGRKTVSFSPRPAKKAVATNR